MRGRQKKVLHGIPGKNSLNCNGEQPSCPLPAGSYQLRAYDAETVRAANSFVSKEHRDGRNKHGALPHLLSLLTTESVLDWPDLRSCHQAVTHPPLKRPGSR